MKKNCLLNILLLAALIVLSQSVSAENIHFNDDIYGLKSTDIKSENKNIENNYFKKHESAENWTSMIEITYFPEINNPIKYSNEIDKKVESDEKKVLLKLIQNKKRDIALISYLESYVKNDKPYLIYNIYKYEKHPQKGMMVLRYAKKYPVESNADITKIANEVKSINNDYMERLIISPIPPIVEAQNSTDKEKTP